MSHVSSTTVLDRLLVQNSDFAGNTFHGIGTGSGAPTVDRIDILNSTFEQNGNGSQNGDGDIVLFGFTGASLIQNVTIAGGANAVPTNANADTAIQINGRDPLTYDVTHPIGNVVFDNVHVTGSYAKVLVYIQGYIDLDGLSFAGNGNNFSGHAGWGWALAIDPTADETSSATPGVPGRARILRRRRGERAGARHRRPLARRRCRTTSRSTSPRAIRCLRSTARRSERCSAARPLSTTSPAPTASTCS